jgi:hypothetical protein
MKFSVEPLLFSGVIVVLESRDCFAMGAPGANSDPPPLPKALNPL